jgi:hypothetical protein
MTHPLPERLSDYLDGDIGAADQQAIAEHLEGCAECAALLTDLRRVVARAQALEDRPPRADLWPGVAAAIGATPPARRRIVFSVPQLLAAGVALMLMTAAGVGFAMRRTASTAPLVAAAGDTTASPSLVHPAEAGVEGRSYDATIRELQGQLAAGRGRLDSVTLRIVDEKLKLVDRAIVEAERALTADPANAYLTGHLTQTRLRKLDLLRRVTALTRQVS